jgi:hypothetical protein
MWGQGFSRRRHARREVSFWVYSLLWCIYL